MEMFRLVLWNNSVYLVLGGAEVQWQFMAYREFYDVPRMVVAKSTSGTFLFYSRFDEDLDDYIDRYEVYLLPELGDDDLVGTWAGLEHRAIQRLPDVPLRELPFSITRQDFRDFDTEHPTS